MIMNTRLNTLLALCLITACQAQPVPKDSVPDNTSDADAPSMRQSAGLAQVHQSLHCGSVTTSQWITSSSQFEALIKTSRAQVVSGKPAVADPVNFSTHAVALISMGQQRTGGYGVKLASTELEKRDDAAAIHIQWREPAKGMIVTQVLTNPCIFISVPLTAIAALDVSKIVAVDASGRVRADIGLSRQ